MRYWITMLLVFGVCSMSFAVNAGQLTVSVKTGPKYIFGQFKAPPQLAIWIEDGQGQVVKTVYVARSSAKSAWWDPKVDRPEALPVWSHHRNVKNTNGGYMPKGGTILPDAETGATPKRSFDKSWQLPASLPSGKYRVYLEYNHSFDFNETFADKLKSTDAYYNGLNGQPSLVWSAEFDVPAQVVQKNLTLIGTGSLTGADGKINPDLSKITSAIQIVSEIVLKIQ